MQVQTFSPASRSSVTLHPSFLSLFQRPLLTLGHIPRALSPIQSSSPALFPASFSASSLVLFIASSSPLPLPSHSSPPPSFASTYPHQHFLTSSFPRFPKPLPLLSPPTPCITHLRATLQPLPPSPQVISKNSPLNAPSNPLFRPSFSHRFSARPEILFHPPNPRPIFWPII